MRLPPPLSPCPTLIGRDAELARGAALLTGAVAGDSAFVLLTGEAGIGKSRLVRALLEAAAGQGFRTLTGICDERDSDVPYAPFLDAIHSLLQRDRTDPMQAIVREHGTGLARLIPELATPNTPPIAALPPEHEKRRLFEAFIHVLARLSDDVPLLFTLEDLHWADDTSIALLELLVRRLSSARILILGAARTDEPGSDLSHWLALLHRQRLVTQIAVPPLDGGDVAKMIAAMVQQPVSRATLSEIQQRAEGNPFLVEELLHEYLVRHGDPPFDDVVPGSPQRVPPMVAEMIAARLGHLDATARKVAEIAAVIGRRVSFDFLRLLSGFDEATVIAALRGLIAAQLMVEEPGATGEWFRFRHALTRDAVYGRLLGPERRQWHRKIVAALAEGGIAEQYTDGERGYHAFMAEAWDAALIYCTQAGEQAQALYAPQEAVEHFSRALVAAERLGRGRASLFRQRGQAHEWGGASDYARQDYLAALSEARGAGDDDAAWQTLMRLSAVGSSAADQQGQSYAHAALALARTRGDRAAIARSLNRLGHLAIFADQPFEAQRRHEEALMIFRSLDDAAGIAETLERLGYARVFGADLHGSAAAFREALDYYTARGDVRGIVFCLVGLSERGASLTANWMAHETTAISDLILDGERARDIAREAAWLNGEAYVLSFLAYAAGASGDYTRAFAWGRTALAIAEEVAHPAQGHLAHGAFTWLYLDLLALPLATRHCHAALALARQLGSRHYLEGGVAALCRIRLAASDVNGAAAALAEFLAPDLPDRTFGQRSIWLARAELALAQGQAAQGLEIAERLIETAPNIDTLPDRSIPRIDLVRGTALTAMGQYAGAEKTLLAARQTAQAQGAQPLLWRLHCALGALYQRMRRQHAAAAEFAAAQSIIEALAASVPNSPTRESFLRSAIGSIPRDFVISPRRVAKARFGGLTAREREVASHVAQGKTNRQIAAALGVTEKTVELHVSNSLRKLDMHSRTELATWAVTSGLRADDRDSSRMMPPS